MSPLIKQKRHQGVLTKKQEETSRKEKLTAQQQKAIVTKIKQAKKNGKIPKSTQQTIPYRQMFKDGLCQLTEKTYSMTIQFFDTNYQLAKAEDKDAIFESWCEFLNYFDSSLFFQLSFVNQRTTPEADIKFIEIAGNSTYETLQHEYETILKGQMEKGNNRLRKNKYITFGLEADTLQAARMKLERIQNEILNNFKMVGVSAISLDGYERVELLHDIMHSGSSHKFSFHWDLLYKTGLSTKDFIAPDSFEFRGRSALRIGRRYGSVSWLEILAPELTDRILSEFLELDSSQIISMHVQPIDQGEALKQIKNVLSNVQKMVIEEQMKAVHAGYSMDIMPPDLTTYSEEAQEMLESLQSRNERMFLVTILIMNESDDKDELENNIFMAQSVATKHNCRLRALDWQQESGLVASLPLGMNAIDIKRVLTTSATAIFMPFTTQELFQNGGLYYGVNALSSNMILADRKKLKNPNGLILGTPGSGKSFSGKREIVNVLLTTRDDILITDPEREYSPVVNAFGGQVIKISADSPHHINLMDINLTVSNEDDEDYDPLTTKSDFILSVCEQIMGGRTGLEPIEKTLIDRCVIMVYQDYMQNPIPEKMPIWSDLYEALKNQPEAEAKRIAVGMERYVMGSLKVFNNRTNVNINNRLVAFDIKDLGKQLKKLGMLIIQDQVWNRVTVNRSIGRTTWAYYDEFHLMLQEEQTASSSVEMWKRFRKWGGIPTGITQNVNDLLRSREISNIFQNSDFMYMLNQASDDRNFLAQRLNISKHQLSYVTNSQEGEGLLIFGGTIIPFVDHFPKDTELYRLMTTKPDEINRK